MAKEVIGALGWRPDQFSQARSTTSLYHGLASPLTSSDPRWAPCIPPPLQSYAGGRPDRVTDSPPRCLVERLMIRAWVIFCHCNSTLLTVFRSTLVTVVRSGRGESPWNKHYTNAWSRLIQALAIFDDAIPVGKSDCKLVSHDIVTGLVIEPALLPAVALERLRTQSPREDPS